MVKKLTPAVRAEQPAPAVAEAAPETFPELIDAGDLEETKMPASLAAEAPEAAVETAPTLPGASHQVRVLRPTAAALNAGIRPGERAPTPVVPVTPKERAERASRGRERNALSRTERLDSGETAILSLLNPASGCRPAPFAPHAGARRTKD